MHTVHLHTLSLTHSHTRTQFPPFTGLPHGWQWADGHNVCRKLYFCGWRSFFSYFKVGYNDFPYCTLGHLTQPMEPGVKRVTFTRNHQSGRGNSRCMGCPDSAPLPMLSLDQWNILTKYALVVCIYCGFTCDNHMTDHLIDPPTCSRGHGSYCSRPSVGLCWQATKLNVQGTFKES